ncbi:MAG: hypothetical protein NTU98_08300 [Bacteroidetes bacterium]|nr:hypothetical protein [Bacteroidota bacterium]
MKHTKYILKHISGTYQINLSIDLEEFKRHVRAGREILTILDLNGSNQQPKPITFLDECEISISNNEIS